MISEILEKCGLNEKDYTIKWSTRKLTDVVCGIKNKLIK